MLNPVLRNEMLPEHRILYDMKMPFADEAIKERIVNAVKHIRKTNRRSGVNRLEAKLSKFGNKGGWYFDRARQLAQRIYDLKPIPNNSLGSWRSVEFELIFKSVAACDEFTHAIRSCGLAESVTIHKDQSIKLNPYDVMGVAQEVVISYRAGDEDAIRKLCKCLKGRAYVNVSCGTHLHIDMRHVPIDTVNEYGARLAQAVPALRLLLPAERRENKFCKTIINTTQTKCLHCNKLSCNCHVQPHKYAFVNLAAYNKHKTIEIRGHSGTINADKIINWIKLCETIMLTPPVAAAPAHTIDELIGRYNLDKHLTAYVKERYARFNNDSSIHLKYSKTEEEENPADQVEVPVHPALLNEIPAAKNAQAAPPPPQFGGHFQHVMIVGNNQ